MYIVEVKTILTEAMRRAFNDSHRVVEFRSLPVSIEFPEKQQDYPGIWVDWEPQGPLEIAGVGHREYVNEDTDSAGRANRWRFQGYATYTVAAMSSLERDRLVDEVARVFAAARENSSDSAYRQFIEDNPFIAMNIDFDQIEQRGFAASPGTPWQTEEIIYEGTLSMEVVGEFTTDLEGRVTKIGEIRFQEYSAEESTPPWPA